MYKIQDFPDGDPVEEAFREKLLVRLPTIAGLGLLYVAHLRSAYVVDIDRYKAVAPLGQLVLCAMHNAKTI